MSDLRDKIFAHKERISGPLQRPLVGSLNHDTFVLLDDLCAQIADLQKKLAEVEGKLTRLQSEKDETDNLFTDLCFEKEAAEAAITRAYQRGLDAAANVRVQGTVGMVGLTDRVAEAILAITPPSDPGGTMQERNRP